MVKKKNILLVADVDPTTTKMLDIVLDPAEFSIEGCASGKEAIHLAISLKPSLILLDLNLPDMDGNEVITTLRKWSQVPIIILTARSTDVDTVKALNLGANDYVTKPFNMHVLEARINACLRQSAVRQAGEPELVNGPLRMDLIRHQVYIHQTLVPFTPKEYELLRYFMVNCGKMLSHREILKEVWGSAHSGNTQYLRVFVGKIREKTAAAHPEGEGIIINEPRIGYRMEKLEGPEPPRLVTSG